MTSGFHTSELLKSASNYPIAKGGPGSGAQPGHPFNGNQYTQGAGGSPSPQQQYHSHLSDVHRQKSQEAERTADQRHAEGDIEGARGYQQLADLHADASEAHTRASIANTPEATNEAGLATGAARRQRDLLEPSPSERQLSE